MNPGQSLRASFRFPVLAGIFMAVLSLATQGDAAGSTAGYDLKKFSVDTSLNRFWLYVDSTINTGTGFVTANHGKVGAGSHMTAGSAEDSFKTTTIIRGNLNGSGPVWVFDSSLYVHGNATLREATFRNPGSIVQVNGAYSINGGVNSSATWVGGSTTVANNNTVFANDLHLGGDIVFSGLNTNPIYLKTIFRGTVFHTNAANAANISTLGTHTVTLANQPYSVPQSMPRFYTASELPGYGLTFTLPPGPENLNGGTYGATVCATGCANYPGIPGLAPGKVLPPGYYGTLDMYSGDQVVLGEGVYYFDAVFLRNSGAKLIAYQPTGGRTIVYAKNGFSTLSGQIFVGPDSGFLANRFGVTSSSTDFSGGTMMIVAGPGAPIRVDSDASMWATLSTPTGTIEANSQFKLYGQMFARHFASRNRFSGAEGEFIPFYPDPPTVSVSKFDAEVREGDVTASKPDTTIAKFVISMNQINGKDVYVWYHTVDGTAVSTGSWSSGNGAPDFVAVTKASKTFLTIPATKLSDTIRIKVIGDKAAEGNERFTIVLDSSAYGALGPTRADSVGTGTILDNDTMPVLRIRDTSDLEGNAGSKNFSFVVQLSNFRNGSLYDGSVKAPIQYRWRTADGTALVADNDYIDSANWATRTILPGILTDTIRVRVVGDTIYERDETFRILIDSATVSGPISVDNNVKKLVGIGTIRNDDGLPVITINDTAVNEGQGVALRASFKGMPKSGDSACFDWKTTTSGTADSATAGKDYKDTTGHACIPAGSNSVTLALIRTLTDNLYENDEKFLGQLTPTHGLASTPDRKGTVTIRSTNPRPTIVIDNVMGKRPSTGTTTFAFKVRLVDAATGAPVATGVTSTVTWKTLRGTALPGLDYDSTAGSLVFSGTNPGDSVKTISVTVLGSKQFHAAGLDFTVALTADANIDTTSLRRKTVGTGTITSAVGAPLLRWSADTVDEGAIGQRTALHFRVILVDSTGAATTSRDPVVFVWSTADSTAKAALPDTHYVARSRVTETIPPNAAGITDSVMVIGNDLHQESLRILFGIIDHADAAASGYDKPRSGTKAPAGIRDADPAPLIQSLANTGLLEGNTGAKAFPFVVRLDRPSGLPVVYSWRTTGVGTATPGTDFVAQAPIQRTIPAGAVIDTFNVMVIGDFVLEADETFGVELTPVSGLGSPDLLTAVDTILNDDEKPYLSIAPVSEVEGSPSGLLKRLIFVVSMLDSNGTLMRNPPALPVSYSWTTKNGTGDSAAYSSATDTDYVGGSGGRTFVPGKVQDTIVVSIRADAKYEYDEWMQVQLSGAVNSLLIGGPSVDLARGTIRNDDDRPGLIVENDSVTEPAKAGDPDSLLNFAIRLSAPAGVPVTVRASTNDSTAQSPADYEGVANTLVVFAPGETAKTISVKVHGDSIYEGVEHLKLVVSGGNNNAVVTRNTGVGTILDQDLPPILHVDTVTVNEGEGASFRISLSNLSSVPVTFKWATSGLSATAGMDYVEQAPIAATIAAMTRSIQVTVSTRTDTLANEGVETFRVRLSDPVGAVIGDSGLGRIVDMTPKPRISINSVIGKEDAGSFSFKIHLDRASATPFDLLWSTGPDLEKPVRLRARSTGADSNYVSRSNVTLLIRAGLTDTTISVVIVDNLLDDPDSLYFRVLLAAKSASDDTAFVFADSIGVGTIVDNDLPPTLGIRDTVATEPAHAASPRDSMKFAISLSSKSAQDITVRWTTVDGTAKRDSDYVARSGTATIPARSLGTTVSIPILADTLWEGTETFTVRLSLPTNATFTDSVAVGSILDNDVPPVLRVGDVVVMEPDTLDGGRMDSVEAVFKVSLNQRSGLPVVFKWRTADSTAYDSANDYRKVLSTTVTIPAGDSVAYLRVWVLSDGLSELTEYFKVLLDKATVGDPNFTLTDSIAVATLKNSNGRPRLMIDDSVSLVEADTAMRFILRLSNKSSVPFQVYLRTVDQVATAGKDYWGFDTVLTIPAFQVLDTLDVRIRDDLLHENAEYFRVRIDSTDSLTDPADPLKRLPGANISGLGYGLGKIIDNDSAPGITISDATLQEPANAGQTAVMTFTVKLTAPSGLPVSVRWVTVDSSAQTTLPIHDYASDGGSVAFAPGDSIKTISVTINGDSLYEGPEVFHVALSDATGGTIDRSLARGVIVDNDVAPKISIDSVIVAEGETARFRVRLERESGLPTSVDWRTVAGTATANLDYEDSSGTVTLPAGELVANIPVRTLADSLSGEGTEAFQVRLSNLRGATAGDTIGLGRITDKTPLPTAVIDSIGPFVEADSTVHFTVRLSGPSAVDVHVDFRTAMVTAEPGIRYLDTTGVLTIPAGQRSGRIAVKILDDSIREPLPETFQMILVKADSALLARPIGLATILDDGDRTALSVGDADTLLEGVQAIFPVTVIGLTKDTVRIHWHTVDGTAKAGLDYKADSGTIVFAPGSRQASIVVDVLKDLVWEPNESFDIRIDSVVHGYLTRPLDSLAHAWIRDANGVPSVEFLSVDTSVWEDRSDSVTVRLGLSGAASIPIKVLVALQPSSAANPADFTVRGLASDTLVFPAGETLATFKVHVVPDSLDEYDEYASWRLQNLAPIRLGSKSLYKLTILDDDSAPGLVFATDTQSVPEDVGAVRVIAKLARVSGKPISASYHVAGSATPGVDHDLTETTKIGFSFAPGIDTASIVFRVVDDRITEATETVDLVLDSARNASLVPGKIHHIVNILDNDAAPTVSFASKDTTVPESIGKVSLRLVLSNPSALPVVVGITARGTATLDSLRKGSDAELDSTVIYRLVVPPMDTVADFVFRVNDDGRVEPTESIDFKVVVVDSSGRAGTGQTVRIEDNDRLPVVEITKPADSLRTGIATQTVSWTIDKIRQPDRDTTLVSGWNTIVRSYTDTAGNSGADTVRVWADLTPPRVQVFKITGPNPHAPSMDTTWWGDRARTRFGRDTIWYWVRDSIQNPDNSWRVKIDTLRAVTNFSGDGMFPTQVKACDSIGNCAVDTGWIDLKQSLPVVRILTPPEGASVVVGTIPVSHEVADGGKTWTVGSVKDVALPGADTVMRCYEDDVGNRGCDTHRIKVEPVHVIKAVYIDSDGDGRVDAMIVDLDSKWNSDSLPSFDVTFNDSTRSNQRPDPKTPYYAGASRGTPVVVGKDTIWVATGSYLRDATGKILVGADGRSLTNVLGDTAFGSDDKPLRDSVGRIYYKVPGPGKTDSTRFLVPIKPPFAFGMTGFVDLQDASMTATWTVRDSAGKQSQSRFVDTFLVDEKVAPVVLAATIRRVEDYSHPDTLLITPSEPLKLGTGRDWLQVGRCPAGAKTCSDKDLIWVDVPDSAVMILPDGRIRFLVWPDSVSIRPDYRVRFRSDVSDSKGNAVDIKNLHWSTVVVGALRPDRVVVEPPTRIPEIPVSERDRVLPGGILIKATKGTRSGANDPLEWWEPKRGYLSGNDASVRAVCPQESYCNGPRIDINRPVRMIIYIYDRSGIFVATRTVDIAQEDIDRMQPDQLDRISIELQWNHRNSDGHLVASGVYLWRIVSFVRVKGVNLPVMTNQVFKVGVKVESRKGILY